MEAILERCAGLDVHQETVVACVLYGDLERKPKQEIHTFSTTTKGLLALYDWLSDWECTHVAMESTGVYWKPVWNILRSDLRSFWPMLSESKTYLDVKRMWLTRPGFPNCFVRDSLLLASCHRRTFEI